MIYHRNTQAEFETAYFVPGENEPAMLKLRISSTIHDWTRPLVLLPSQLTAKVLQNECPFLRFSDRQAKADFEEMLLNDLFQGLRDGTITRGYYLTETGAAELPDGSLCFVRGSEVVGNCTHPYLVAPELGNIRLLGMGTSLQPLIPLLLSVPKQALLVLAYVILSSIRSLVLEAEIDLQAVLYIVGGQGLGKTTLATRLAGIYEHTKNHSKVGVIQAGSTTAAAESLMLALRDQPMVVDDLCLSAGKETERKRRELGAKLVRQGAGRIPIIKRSGKKISENPCEAGLILTAEFSLQNLSDLTRCLIVPVNKKMDLPNSLTPELIGEAVRQFSNSFASHCGDEINRFKSVLSEQTKDSEMDVRMVKNYKCLCAVFAAFVRFLPNLGATDNICSGLIKRMDSAVEDAKCEHMTMVRRLNESIPIGNLSFIIFDGLENHAFDLTKKVEKLGKHGGIIWKGDLCLRKEELTRYVRLQSGYQSWSLNKITRSLKDLGALVIQEDDADTVHLQKSTPAIYIPRVYRIRINVLEETAERC